MSYCHAHFSQALGSRSCTVYCRDEMAAYDLPASLALALAVSNASRLAYVGHSQGTTIALAALASQPALAARVRWI